MSAAAHAAARNDAPRATPVAFTPVTLSTGPRPGWATLAALAVVAGLAAVGLGAWALVTAGTGSSSAGVTARETALESSVAVLASPRAVRVPLTASARRLVLVVGDRNEAVLLVRGLGRAVDGRAYQAWVKRPGSARQLPAGLFDGADGVVRLTQPVLPRRDRQRDGRGRRWGQPAVAHPAAHSNPFLALGSDSGTVLAQLLRPVQRGIGPLEETRRGLPLMQLCNSG